MIAPFTPSEQAFVPGVVVLPPGCRLGAGAELAHVPRGAPLHIRVVQSLAASQACPTAHGGHAVRQTSRQKVGKTRQETTLTRTPTWRSSSRHVLRARNAPTGGLPLNPPQSTAVSRPFWCTPAGETTKSSTHVGLCARPSRRRSHSLDDSVHRDVRNPTILQSYFNTVVAVPSEDDLKLCSY